MGPREGGAHRRAVQLADAPAEVPRDVRGIGQPAELPGHEPPLAIRSQKQLERFEAPLDTPRVLSTQQTTLHCKDSRKTCDTHATRTLDTPQQPRKDRTLRLGRSSRKVDSTAAEVRVVVGLGCKVAQHGHQGLSGDTIRSKIIATSIA